MPAVKESRTMKMIPILGILALASFPPTQSRAADWLIDPSPFRAAIATNAAAREITLENGLLRRVFKLEPDAATVAFDNLMTGEAILRSVRPEAQVQLDGKNFDVGGLLGQPVHNYLDPAWLAQMKANPAAVSFRGPENRPDRAALCAGETQRMAFARRAVAAARRVAHLGLQFTRQRRRGRGRGALRTLRRPAGAGEMADGSERIATTGHPQFPHGRATGLRRTRIHRGRSGLEFSRKLSRAGCVQRLFLRRQHERQRRRAGHSLADDPLYTTQVSYPLATPCLLQCCPPIGPEAEIKPGETFESFRVFELVHDSTERERRGLAVRRAYRALAPWAQENPILMHVRSAAPEAVKTGR